MVDNADNWPPNGGRMGALIRAQDWAQTALGPMASWPVALKVAVSAVLDSRLAAIVLWGPQLIQIYNDVYQPVLGPRHPAALGQATAACWPEVWHFNEPIYRRVLAGGEVVHLEDQEFAIDASGLLQSHYFTITYAPARDETGEVRGVVVQVVETTDRVLLARQQKVLTSAVEATRRQQAFNLALSDLMRDVGNPDDLIAEASAMLARELGADRVLFCEIDDLRGTFDIRRDWVQAGTASVAGKTRLLADFGEALIGTLRAGKTVAVDDVGTDSRAADVQAGYLGLGVKAFLAIPLVQRGHLSVVLAVHREQPHVWRAEELALCEEFVVRTWAAAENAKAQAALKLERDQSDAVFESMTEGFGLVDKDWTILRMNETGLTISQRTASQVIGKNHWDVWPELRDTELARLYDTVKQTGVAGAFEYPHTFSNGVQTWVEVRSYRTLDGGLAFFFRDIGERKAAEDKLREMDRRKDEFLAMLAHELRNPLSPISAAASLLMLGPHDAARVKKASEIIARQVRHMSALIDDLLDVSRVTSGLIELDYAVIDAKRIVADAIEQVRPLIESRHHRLELKLSADSTFVRGDYKRLVQVLTNLLNNAAKYTSDGGNIVVTTLVQAQQVVLSVSDDGIGMTPSLLERAFDLFEQESRSSDRSQGGLGLGLALVKSLVALHGGSVVGNSNGVSAGCIFTVSLPRVDAPETAAGRAPGMVASQRSPRLRMLVVDDNVDAGNTLCMLLSALGHHVVVAFDGAGALAQLTSSVFDIALLDIGLPDMTGYELAVRLRARSPQAMTLIAVTGYGQKQDALDSVRAGFDHHLLKPIDTARLLELIEIIGSTVQA